MLWSGCGKPETRMQERDWQERTRQMAREFYGFGKWDAPYWFIGQEQGMGSEDIVARMRAWNGQETDDCIQYHSRLNEPRWHGEYAICQRTWCRMIRLLFSFLGKEISRQSVLDYQKTSWGSFNGDTAVLELSGIPGKNLLFGKKHSLELFNNEQLQEIRRERLKRMQEAIKSHPPKLLVCYGTTNRRQWHELLGHELQEGVPLRAQLLGLAKSTTVLLTQAPAAYGLTTVYWNDIELRLSRVR